MLIGNAFIYLILTRDIKPENILFTKETLLAPIKIIDFGRSKILKHNEKMRELAGSLYYIAPEVLTGNEYNELCDIWSCGVIMYLLLVGRPPFLGKTKEDVIRLIYNGVEFSSNYNDSYKHRSNLAKDHSRVYRLAE